jgi:sugar lactone lactonase YvrE
MDGSAGATAAAPAAPSSPWDRPGFATIEEKGRIWVFAEGSKDLADFRKKGEPAKSITRPGAGPSGKTLRGPDADVLDGYQAWKPGFVTAAKDGRLWVFLEDAKELAEFRRTGEPAKSVTRPGAGPGGRTLRGPDAATLDLYMASRPGFAVRWEEACIWIFRADAKELEEFDRTWELAKSVTRVKAGPAGRTLRSADAATLDAWAAAK